MSANSLEKAQMRSGDFHLRRGDRQMFGNSVVLSAGAGVPGPLEKLRHSATVVATPVYDVPKLWALTLDFADGISAPLTPWVPLAQGANIIRVKVTHALDRDKQTAVEQVDLGAPIFGGSTKAFPTLLYVGLQVTVSVEIVPVGSNSAPLVVQASLREVTGDERDPYRSVTITAFSQSAVSALFLARNSRRRQFFVQNVGTSPLYVAFDLFAVGPGVGAHFTYCLPNRFDVYESPRDCWQGDVAGIWSAAGGATDQALVTEGF
jgi:hypothetical protein